MTSLDQNFSDLANILMQRRQQAKSNRLADLQYKQLQREDNYQTGLQSAMSNPRQAQTSMSITPEKPQLSLAMLGGQMQPQQFQPSQVQPGPVVEAYGEGRMQTQTTPGQTPAQAGAKYALSQGRVEDAVKMFSVDDMVAQLQAKGDLQGYYKAKQELDQGKQFFEAVKPYVKNPAAMKQLWPQIQRAFPNQTAGINPEDIQDRDGATFMPLEVKGQVVPNRVVYHDADGSIKIVDTTPKADPDAMLDKRFANQQKLQAEQIAAQARNTDKQIDAADRRAISAAAQKDRAPGKILPAGQLESIADMKRVKDVLAEANSDMSTGKVSTGPVAGRLQALSAKVGAADDSFVNVQQKLQTAQNIMLKLRSGAAVTESEYARFLKEYPTPNDSPATFKRKMANTLAYANTLMDDKMTIYEEGGYKVPQSVRSKPAAQQKGNAPRVTKGGFKITVVK